MEGAFMKKLISIILIMCLFNVSFANIAFSYVKDYNYYKNVAPEDCSQELKSWFKNRMAKNLNLDNPQTFNEKIQWLKLYDSTPIKTQLTDKYLVKDWIKEKIGEKYVVPLLGVYNSFDEIDFDKLPNKFMLKCNHGSGWNFVVKDKNKLNKAAAKKLFDLWMNKNFAYCAGFELQYKNIKPKIIAETYLENNGEKLGEYKVWCFNGKPEFIMFMNDRLIFDKNWNVQPFYGNNSYKGEIPSRPQKLDEMLEVSQKLSSDFAFVRVDFYLLNDGTIKFGEMTFTPNTGTYKWNLNKYDKILGEMINLPKEKHDYNSLFH